MALFGDIYRNKTVLVTGHTGFKGSWLCLWLAELGARVVGFSLPPPTKPDHFGLLKLDMVSVIGDVRDRGHLQQVFAKYEPAAVFHLAAQPIVRRSYRDPDETFSTNIQGTINLYEVCRSTPSVRAIVAITTDKVYENHESPDGYVETDALGGSDPYSCSKACAELITACYRHSYFHPQSFGDSHQVLLASVRAGNVIGGGDWAEDRLVPDAMKATARNEAVFLRNPRSVRPWQHVLEPLSGYLLLGQRLLEGEKEFAEAWNFGPADEGHIEVELIIRQCQRIWPKVRYESATAPNGPHETGLLKLQSNKARQRLDWRPVWCWQEAVERTAAWYRRFYEDRDVCSLQDLGEYIGRARQLQCGWSG